MSAQSFSAGELDRMIDDLPRWMADRVRDYVSDVGEQYIATGRTSGLGANKLRWAAALKYLHDLIRSEEIASQPPSSDFEPWGVEGGSLATNQVRLGLRNWGLAVEEAMHEMHLGWALETTSLSELYERSSHELYREPDL